MSREAATSLLGTWESNEAFGNTALDWSQAVKDQRVQLQLTFESGNKYKFRLLSNDGEKDVTSEFRHVVASEGSYTLKGEKEIVIHGDNSGIVWTFMFEEEDNLRIRYDWFMNGLCTRLNLLKGDSRLEGAKRWGRCKGVDVIYFDRVKEMQ